MVRWPIWTWSISCGAILASTIKLSPSGTISITASVLRRDQVEALELILGDALSHQLGFLAANFGQLLADLGAQILVDLQDFQLSAMRPPA
jgi:hypothetical protein